MEQLALFALPRVEPDDDRSDGEGESDEEEEAEEVQVTDDDVIVPDQDGQLNDEEEDLSSRFSGDDADPQLWRGEKIAGDEEADDNQRERIKTTLIWACIFCPDRRLFSSKQDLQGHAVNEHQDRLPSATDQELLAFLESFAMESRHYPGNAVSSGSRAPNINIQQTSSYWSVPEQTDFPALLKCFGTDWHAIANFMTSKTHVMVCTTAFHRQQQKSSTLI
jgi:hypothetical protein